jgi:hypothetical protein
MKHRLTAKEGAEAVDLAQNQPKLDTSDLATVKGTPSPAKGVAGDAVAGV